MIVPLPAKTPAVSQMLPPAPPPEDEPMPGAPLAVMVPLQINTPLTMSRTVPPPAP
jgi:hypothetical protein